LDMIFGVNGEIIGYSKYYKFNFYSTIILAFLAIGSNIYFIKRYGMNGAAFASLLTLMVFNISKYLFIWKKFNLHAFSFGTLKLVIIALSLTFSIKYLPPNDNLLIDIIMKSAVFGSVYLVVTYISKASTEYNQLINKVIDKIS